MTEVQGLGFIGVSGGLWGLEVLDGSGFTKDLEAGAAAPRALGEGR